MKMLTWDYETFYSRDFSLSRVSMEEYIRSSQFEVIMVAVKEDDKPTEWFSGTHEQTKRWLKKFDWENSACVGHNNVFDCAIGNWHFDIRPKRIIDTLSMGRALYGNEVGVGLASLAKFFGLGEKGHEVVNALGKRRADFTWQELNKYAEYCVNDVELTYKLVKNMLGEFPLSELKLIDLTIRMFSEPVLELDKPLLETHLKEVQEKKMKLLMSALVERADLMSNPKFAELLRVNGVEPPTKVSKTTGKETYAFSKTDEEFLALKGHENPAVQALVSARIGNKSTLEETRTEAFIGISGRGTLPVPLRYYGAHCVPGDTEVLTRHGWERLDVWEGGDIAQWKPDGSIEFLSAERHIGDEVPVWVKSSAPYMPVSMTCGHKVPVLCHGSHEFKETKAVDLLSRSSTIVPLAGALKNTPKLTAEQTRVLVMIQADGSFEENTAAGRRMSLWLKKPRKIARARQLLKDAGVIFKEQTYNSGLGYVRFIVPFANYPAWLSPTCKQYRSWVLDCDLDAFSDELTRWDGWTQSNQRAYATNDKETAEWAATALHLSSLCASIAVKPQRGNRKTMYTVTIRERAYCHTKRVHFSPEHVARKAYCAKTQTGWWVARANGRIFITGNTGRYSAQDGINLQNLPRKSNLKKSIRAPNGYKLIDCDSSQIECRMLAWLSGQDDLVAAFERGEDVYCIMASVLYGRPITKADEEQRFVGKTVVLGCFAEDTKVLTDSGWKPIVSVRDTDKVWDGVEWVNHGGLVNHGIQKTLRHQGVAATLDHEILTERGWVEWSKVCKSPRQFRSALNRANLPSCHGNTESAGTVDLLGTQESSARVGGLVLLIDTILRGVKLPGVIPALRKLVHEQERRTGDMRAYSPIQNTGYGYLTAYPPAYSAAITPNAGYTQTMAGVESMCTNRGEQIAPRSSLTSSHLLDGIFQSLNLTASTLIKVMGRAILGLSHGKQTLGTEEPSSKCSESLMTYDISYAGPRNRYTIATSVGPIIVHNSGYGTGWKKLQDHMKTNPQQRVDMSAEEAKRTIDTYRSTYSKIPMFWKQCDRMLDIMAKGQYAEFGPGGVIKVIGEEGIMLPNGMRLKYPNLHKTSDGFVYHPRKGRTTFPKSIWGGGLTENICQALARIAVTDQMLEIAKRYRVVLTVHDSVISLVPENESSEALKYVEACMRKRPPWGPELPLNCEAKIGYTYGG